MKRIAIVAGLAVAAACGPAEQAPPPAQVPPAPAATRPSPGPAPPSAPAPAPAPPPAEPAAMEGSDATRGEPLYATYCASCHGPRGAGDGPAGAALNPKPARHDDGAYMNALSNEHLLKVIQEGGMAVGKSALMAPWGGTLGDAQIRDVVAFVRSLAKPAYEGPRP